MTAQPPIERSRARELGILLGTLPSGPQNAMTDVAGVRVGHATLVRGSGPLVRGVGPVRTGVTAILPHEGNLFTSKVPAAGTVFNGFGKSLGLMQIDELGQVETPILLTNTLNVGRVADALVAVMLEQNPAIGVSTLGTVNAVVCECNDGFLNDIQGRHVGEPEVRTALAQAAAGPVAEGNVGAGTGMIAYGFAGGIGTASRRIDLERGGYTLGALVLANFGSRSDLLIAGIPVGRELERESQPSETKAAPSAGREQGSVIVLLATDAPLDARELGRLTRRVPLGLARTGTHMGHGSGDLAIAFSTARRIPYDTTPLTHMVTVLNEQHPALDALFLAVVEATEEAVLNALCAAHSIEGRDGHRVEALPLEATLAILRRQGVAVPLSRRAP